MKRKTRRITMHAGEREREREKFNEFVCLVLFFYYRFVVTKLKVL